jgi:hypothetical protein
MSTRPRSSRPVSTRARAPGACRWVLLHSCCLPTACLLPACLLLPDEETEDVGVAACLLLLTACC